MNPKNPISDWLIIGWSHRFISPQFVCTLIPLTEKIAVSKNKESFTVYMCVEGAFTLIYKGETYQYKVGDTVLIPASLSEYEIAGTASLLEIYIS